MLLGIGLASCNTSNSPSLLDKQLYEELKKKAVLLPNGWKISPAGRSLPLGDFPMNMVLSPSRKLLAITHNGQSKQSIALVDPQTEKLLDEIEIRKAWYGLVFSKDEKALYASGGNDNQIKIYSVLQNKLQLTDSIVLGKAWPEEKISPTGIDLDEKGEKLYAVTKEDSALYLCDVKNKQVEKKLKINSEAYACLYSAVHKELYISLWGNQKIAVYDPAQHKITAEIKVEDHPNDLCLSKNGKYLFVANANSNSVSVIDIKARKVLENISTSLHPDAPIGSTSNAVALTEDEKTLLIANADNNYLALFDISEPGESKSMGFIPVGWYPTSVKVANNKIFVSNGKGNASYANPKGPNPYKKRDKDTQYIGALFKGTLSVIDLPDNKTLATYSKVVYDNTPYSKEKELNAEGEKGNPIPQKAGEKSPIKYVFYIIKENRTYDQVFGDIKEGKGDSSLCLFPEFVSPNHHALAREFVLLDNFYVNAEVSADGHNWSMAAYATDFTEKTWPTNYGGRGGNYDYEGNRKIASPTKGYIWDHCKKAGVTYRSYGEFVWDGKVGEAAKALEGNIDTDYQSYDLKIKDIARFEKWKQDFDSLMVKNALKQLNIIRIGNDHTSGARKGMPTPRAAVADNDLALGRIVEHISKSKIWKESAIFVLEDDAQNGPDHIDAHRSIALVVSPYVRRKSVNSTLYTTSSMLRTIGLILGIPPMSQYDAAATPMYGCFTSKPDLTSYIALKNNIDLDELNQEDNKLSRLSYQFNLEQADAAPDLAFSEVIWKTVKGEKSEMPAPRRSAFIIPRKEEEGD